ncbi:hypothetical protein Pan258_27960 [Symmachiella dynata]|uniref:outer membrane protein assembly factor BamE n=1 Tax=Symmachiella dynata TaxID=2527995 RepID=UPI00118B3D08|nr:outer membrane protein assembly factor BamE [Symmachiella dynata]QDT48751.1 hypothetical protein Pan258_27960 [Symmachiella dynata]
MNIDLKTPFLFLGLCGLLLGAGCSGGTSAAPFNKASFDKKLWNAGGEQRQFMILDIQTQHLHPGMDQSDVLTLLGKPDHEALANEVTRPAANADIYFYYDIGLTPEAFDTAQFVVVFDGTGTVIETSVFEN